MALKNLFLAMAAGVLTLVIGVKGWPAIFLLIPGWILGKLAWKADAYEKRARVAGA
jgi:hypothetical protein